MKATSLSTALNHIYGCIEIRFLVVMSGVRKVIGILLICMLATGTIVTVASIVYWAWSVRSILGQQLVWIAIVAGFSVVVGLVACFWLKKK